MRKAPIALLAGAGAIILGCAGAPPTQETAQAALRALAPIASEALRAAAASHGVELDEGAAACFAVPQDELPVIVAVCVAPQLQQE